MTERKVPVRGGRDLLRLYLDMVQYVMSGHRTYEDIRREFSLGNDNLGGKVVHELLRRGWVRKDVVATSRGALQKFQFIPVNPFASEGHHENSAGDSFGQPDPAPARVRRVQARRHDLPPGWPTSKCDGDAAVP